MGYLDTDIVDQIQSIIGGVTGDLWNIPVVFEHRPEPVLGKVEERSAEYTRDTYGDEVERVVTVMFEQQLWMASGGDSVEEGRIARYGGLKFEIRGIKQTGMLKDRFLYIEMDLVR